MVRTLGLAVIMTVVGLWGAARPTRVEAQAEAGAYLPPSTIDANLQEKSKGLRDAVTAKSRIISGADPFDAQAQTTLRGYYEGYLFKVMTLPERYGDIQDDVRKSTLTDLRNAATRSKDLHDFVVNLVLTQMKPLVEQNHHPIVRVNATLFIGELNAEERGTTTQAPTPLPAALTYLREQLNNPTQVDGVRVAALAGINRHVEAAAILDKRLPDDVIGGLSQELVTLIASEPIAGRSPDVHAWLQGRAIDVLGGLCGWVPSEPSFQALAQVLADPKSSISLRCRAAYAMSRVKYADLPNADKANWPEITGSLAGLLADACKMETDFLDAEKKKLSAGTGSFGTPGMPGGDGGFAPPGEPGGMGAMGGGKGESPGAGGMGGMMSGPGGMGMGGMGGMGMFGGSSAKLGGLPVYKVDGSRRRLLYEMACVNAAMNGPTKTADVKGIKALAQNDQTANPMVTKLEKALADLDKTINVVAKDVDLDAMLKTMRTRGQELEQLRPVDKTATPDPASDVPSADVPTGDVPGGAAPAGNPPAGGGAPGDPPAGNPPAGNPPAGNPPAGNPPPGNPPAGGGAPNPGGNGDVPPP